MTDVSTASGVATANNNSNNKTTETIALFGATGMTGRYCLLQALERGYKVNAMVRTKAKIDVDSLPSSAVTNLTLVEGDFTNKSSIEQCVQGTTYVVCMAGHPPGQKSSYPPNLMLNFFKLLTQTIQKSAPNVKVVLYQAGAFSVTPGQRLPFMTNIIKTVVGEWIMKLGPNVDDNNDVISYVSEHNHEWSFRVIITRPAMIKDYGPKTKDTLVAERFTPPSSAVGFYDLATFSLKALTDESLYGQFPYVVAKDRDLLNRHDNNVINDEGQ